MKTGLYARLAWTGMVKNRRLYLPYLLSCTGMVLMFYILLGLSGSPMLAHMSGGGSSAIILRILRLGTVAIAVFSLLFLFYTHSFLIRRREREFGLYNVLGMGKGNIARILLWETAITYGVTAGAGLILGVVLLGGAYWLAVSIKEPLAALLWFFTAVIMVILATYLLFISGSVTLCRGLQSNKSYYYDPRHFVSVSSMAYRMKRNGAGLASVCILATMVLVMISSTTCLYFGQEDAVNARYPHDLAVTVYGGEKLLDEKEMAELRQGVENTVFNFGGEVSNVAEYRELSLSGLLDGGNLTVDASGASATDSTHVIQIHFVPLEEYNALTGQSLTLEDGQVYVATLRMDFDADTLSIDGGMTRHVMKREITPLGGAAVADITPSLTVVVRDFEQFVPELQDYLEGKYGWHPVAYWNYGFDTDLPENQQANIDGVTPNLKAALDEYLSHVRSDWNAAVSVESKAGNRADFYGTYGGLFFLGIMLSIVFIFAAVAILYYKQLSEGYEDQSRFDIMQKVGMTKGDIRRSINSQLLTVFSLPLLMAGVHLCFAFPFIHKLLMLFNLDNKGLLIGTTAVSFAVFAVLYALVYKLTGNAYYHIVADGQRE